MPVFTGQVVTPIGIESARIIVEGDRIERIERVPGQRGSLIVPGFIDLHCHGGGGADVMEGAESVKRMAEVHTRHGTTSLLATTMTDSVEAVESALNGIGAAMNVAQPGSAAVLGVHLEGPFISPDKLGAQPDAAIPGDLDLIKRWMALAPIRVVTCAPEADPEGTLTAFLNRSGVRVQIGHSDCSYETAARCFESGRHGVTHMFNAMSALNHRAPGVAGAALAHAEFAELIPDLLHVHPGAIRAALRAIPQLYAVTDATPAAGMPDGDFRLGTQLVRKCGNGVRLADGTLAGSSLTMIDAFRNLVSIGMNVAEAARRCSTIPADYLGLTDRGRLCAGAVADLLVLGEDLTLQQVCVAGEMVETG
ncbi:N-acetylglucosamine-6-phosphate deacetylase [Cucumibacter marinus]|uniref:N-acetylglucosamine-6-phosphate deacetylase n=1 Tax=Cucumibacter marinus TaxID=1121252 RepID=UPI000413C488|nr:N-acetylglucosamine-6-phosphate deacetylase [Cucumibacter marinus]